jgi:arsenate reductase
LTIYHNPACSTSRKVLGMLREAGLEPKVVEYLKVGWTRPVLDDLLTWMQAEPRTILRGKEALAEDLGLAQPGVSGEAILAAMIAHPVLVERPIVVGPKGTAVCRPVEVVEGLI